METNILIQTEKMLGDSDSLTVILIFLGIVAFIALIFILVFVIFLIRRLNIIAQKVDYLVEDITYKVEALTPTVDIINKFSNYAITADVITNKSVKEFYKLLKNNQTSLLKLFQNILSQFNKVWESKKTDKSKKASKQEFDDGETIILNQEFPSKNKSKKPNSNDSSKTKKTSKQEFDHGEAIIIDLDPKKDNMNKDMSFDQEKNIKTKKSKKASINKKDDKETILEKPENKNIKNNMDNIENKNDDYS